MNFECNKLPNVVIFYRRGRKANHGRNEALGGTYLCTLPSEGQREKLCSFPCWQIWVRNHTLTVTYHAKIQIMSMQESKSTIKTFTEVRQ